MKGLATDEGAVMVGRKSGLGVLLQLHCICHRLTLACTDTNVNLKNISTVETEVTQPSTSVYRLNGRRSNMT